MWLYWLGFASPFILVGVWVGYNLLKERFGKKDYRVERAILKAFRRD